ncbi:MAG: hypothetical protein GXP05_04390 [Alphaproteobacteria bacterium]|nr:hypothetical protein [Alphaproteobacteria bacterium]
MSSFTFPLALTDFLDLLPISKLVLDNPEQVEASGTGGGEIITAELAPQLWTGEIKLTRMNRNAALRAGALIDMVRGPSRGFMVCDMTRRGPAFDPDGSYIAAFSPVISALNADNLQIKISGLPAYYTLTRGDMLGWQYGTSTRSIG